jgi:hypothetical protein
MNLKKKLVGSSHGLIILMEELRKIMKNLSQDSCGSG